MRQMMGNPRFVLGACFLGLIALAKPAVAAAPPALEAYGTLPSTETLELSPDGSMIAMVGMDGDKRVLTVETVEGKPLARALVGDLKLSGLAWAGNNFVVVYMHLTARLTIYSKDQEFVEGILLDVRSGKAKPLVRSAPDYLPAIFGSYGFALQDGHWFAYVGLVPTEPSRDITESGSGYFKQRYPDLYRVELETGAVQRVTKGTTRLRSWVVDTSGQIVAESEYNPNDGAWAVFLPGAQDHPIASGKSPFNFSFAGLSRRPGTVLVREGGVDGDVVELHLDSGRTEVFLPAGKATELIHSRLSKLLLGAVMVDDGDAVMFDPTLERHYKSIAKAFHDHGIRLTSVSDDLSRVIVHVTGQDTAGTWQLVDFKTGRSDPVADDYPGIPGPMLGPIHMVDYRAADGLAMQGVLTLPPGLPPHALPLVVLPHGGPEARDEPFFDWWAQAFASRGYAVFQPNFRGSAGYGMAFRNAGFGQWGRKMQTDISDGVAALAAKGIIDPRRACIVGASYGGYAALAGVTVQHGLYRCAASYGGLGDMHQILYATKDRDRGSSEHYADPTMRYWQSYMGSNSPSDDSLDAISPRLLAKNADAPILLIYGEKDTVVPPAQSEDMASALKRAGKPVELVELDAEDHWLSRSATRLQMLKAMVAFVQKYNPADPAPGK
jgi:dipeptidyl aminopeptidase/acylaminoacyl peptidase